MTREELTIIIKGIAPTLRRLEARIAALEARPEMKYLGVFDPATHYEPGHFVTKGGSLWCCLKASTGATPGVSVDAWRLAVKSGRDGRAAR